MSLLEQWQHSEPVPLFVSDGEIEQEYRLIFKTMSAFDHAKFVRNRSKIGDIADELYGGAEERTEEQHEDYVTLLNVLIQHAAIMAALAKVELRNGDVWESARLPESWYDQRQAAFTLPAGIINTLFEAVIDAGNPIRLFSLFTSADAEKKAIRLTVKPSAR